MDKELLTDTDMAGQSQMDTRVWYAVGAIAVVCVGLIILVSVKALSTNSGNPQTTTTDASPAPASLVQAVTAVDETTFAAVGAGSVTVLPTAIAASALTVNNKPEVFYAGAEFCPFCAAERWPVVVALSRFGAFSNLKVSHSSTTDSYPNTQTFSFHGATYSSPYLTFEGVETLSNQPQGSGYAPLDTLSAAQQKIVNTFNAPPYLPSADAGSIPFIDFGGSYLVSGAAYSPEVLQGKSTDQIAAALKTNSDPITQGIIGEANILTATICSLTGNQPGAVCNSGTIPALEKIITAQKKMS